jgi:hypothetical protein
MQTIEEGIIDHLQRLTELELQAVLEGLSDHLRRQKLTHVAYGAFGFDGDREEELEDEIEDLKSEIQSLNEKIDDAKSALS